MNLNRRILRKAITLWGRVRPKFHTKLGGRDIVISPIHEYTLHLLSWCPDWKTSCVEKILRDRPGVFLDVGANIGQTLFDYLSTGTRRGYIGFEPSPPCVDQLNDVFNSNGLLDCKIVPIALSNTNGITSIYFSGELTETTATMIAVNRTSGEMNSYFASMFRYDDISNTIGLQDKVSLVKIDVEGAELLVIEGMKQLLSEDRPWIICEVLSRDLDADPVLYTERCRNIMSLINTSNYICFSIGKSADFTAVTKLTRCYEFPEIAHHKRDFMLAQLDYLFIPSSDAANANKLFA